MAEHEIEIEILPDGRVKAKTNGVTGEGCEAYAKLIEEVVGRISQQEMKPERHMPGEIVEVKPVKQQVRR